MKVIWGEEKEGILMKDKEKKMLRRMKKKNLEKGKNY